MSDTIEIVLLAKDEASKTIGGVKGALGGLGGAMGAAGAAIVGGAALAGGAIVAFGASSVGVARDFESAMAVMSTAVDPASLGVESAAEAMSILGDASLAVGSDTALVGVSASSAAEAITGLYKAGLDTGEVFGDLQGYLNGTAELGGALRASVDLAAASELDMVAASELAAVTLATFGGELTTTEERAAFVEAAMNNFVQTADGSVASVGDLAAAMVNVGSTMASFGIPLEDVNTALGILSTRGIVGAEAGTALKSMFLNMMNAPGAADALEDLNIKLYDMEGNMKPLPTIIGDIEGAMAGMTEEQRNQIGVQLAGSHGIKAFSALMEEGTEGWGEMEAAIGSAATMQETAAARTNTLAGAQEALAGVWETLQIQVGTALVPLLTSLADIGAALIEKYGPTLTAIFDAVGGAIGRLIAIVANGGLGEMFTIFEDGSTVLEGIFEAFGMSETAARKLATGIIEFVTTITEALGPVVTFVTEFVSMKDVMLAAGVAIATVLIPIIASIISAIAPVILIFGAVIAVVALLRNAWENNWGGIQEKVAAVIGFIVPLVQTGISTIKEWWDTNGAALLARAQEIFTGIQTTIQTVIGGVIDWWNSNWPTIQATVEKVWGIVKTVIQTAIDIIRPAIETLIKNVKEGMSNLERLAGPLQDLWAKVGPFIQSAATIIGGILTALLGVITGIVKGIAAAVKPLIDTFINVAENIIRIVGGIIEFLTGFFQAIIGLVTGDGERVKDAFRSMWEGIKDIIGGLVEGIWELFVGLVETVATLLDGFITGIIEFFQNLYDELVGHSIIPDMIKSIVQWFEDLITWIVETLGKLYDAVIKPFIDMWTRLVQWWAGKVSEALTLGKNLVQGIIDGINALGMNILNVLGDWVQAAITYVKNLLGISSPSQVFFEIGENIGLGLIEGIRSTAEDVTAAIDEILQGASNLSGLGSNFASIFEQQAITPLQQALDALSPELEGLTGSLEEVFANLSERFGYEVTMNDPGIESLLKRVAWEGQQYSDPARKEAGKLAELALAQLEARNILLFEQSELQKKLELQQEKMMQLEIQRQQLGFLQEQFNLIKLINENGLDASLLEGLDFGLNADPAALMNAMIAATQEMINAANSELDTNPPYAPKSSLAGDFFAGVGTMGGGGTVVNIDARRADRGAAEDIRRVVVQVLNEYGIRADIRMRTN